MKCPKCGSEMTKHWHEFLNQCSNIDCIREQKKHQQRLDKVLSKFEGNIYDIDKYTTIDYINDECKHFVLTTYSCVHTISLDTVEHLIKDIERG